jgi:plasmid stabilization system protein ParE
MAEFDDAAATWALLNELERRVLAAVDRPHLVTPADVARSAGTSRQRAALVARRLREFGLVRVIFLPKQTSYELTGQGEACLRAGKNILDSSQADS